MKTGERAINSVKHSVRGLMRAPWFTAVAVLTLAVGIGATTAIFSVVYGVVLKPLPFAEPEGLVGLYHRAPGINIPVVNQGAATYFVYRDNQRAFEGIGAWDRQQRSVLVRGRAERVEALAVNDATLRLLRVQPLLGRFFDKEDDQPGSPLRVILTYAYWQRSFAGARDVIGQPITIGGQDAQIIGVLPSSFAFLRSNPEIVVPLRADRAEMDGVSFGFQALARLRPGLTLEDANADIARMIPLLNSIPGFSALRLEANVRPLSADVVGDIERIIWILMATVAGVLAIACANVANLFLVRTEGRHQELAIRAALGASRGRLAAELLTESVLIGVLAGIVGVLLADAGLGVLRTLAPATLPRINEIGIDPLVLSFALLVSMASGVAFGALPAARLSAVDPEALRQGRFGGNSSARQHTRTVLAVAQVALALVLLIGSGLLIRTSFAMRQVWPGFERAAEVQTFRVSIPQELIADDAQAVRAHERIVERLRQLPGVAFVGVSSHITMDGEDNGNPLRIEHVNVAGGVMPPLRRFKTLGPDYFETLGNPMAAGRALTWADIHQRRRVAVVSSALAHEYWRTPTDALGKRVRMEGDNNWYEIVGVSGNERDDGLNRPSTAIVYWPLLNDTYMPRTVAYAVRSSRVGTPGFLRELQHAVASVNPNLPLANAQTLEEIRENSMTQTSFIMVMLAIAATLALLLGVIGIYGVVAYLAARRTREMGIRLALGAPRSAVLGLVLRHGLILTGGGIAIGLIVSLALTRVMSALLFGVGAADPLTYAGVSAVLAGAAMFATWLPAFRASRLEPNAALRTAI